MKKAMQRAALVLAFVILPASVRAQCPAAARTGHLGITQLECDCVIAPVTRSTQWRFHTEPKILRIEPGSPADGRLQPGDVIVSINGQAVTGASGANLLARPPHERDIAIAVRRDGRVLRYTLRATAVCPTDGRLLGVVPAVLRVTATPPAPPAGLTPPAPVPTVTAVTPAATPTPPGSTPTPPAVALVPFAPPVWIGVAFSCRDCTYEARPGGGAWSFRTSPEVYSVEPGSPAYVAGLRRGDVLTHIDDAAITSAEGGRRWAALQTGDEVRLRYRRGEGTRTAVVRVAPARTPAYVRAAQPAQVAAQWQEVQRALTQSDTAVQRLLRQYQQTMANSQGAQERALLQLMQRMQSGAAQSQTDAALRAYVQQQTQAQTQQQTELERLLRQSQLELSRAAAAQTRVEELTRASVQAAVANVTYVAPVAPGTQRYSGTFGGVDVEVRGANPVIVSESGDELVIRMADGSTIRLKRPAVRR